MFSLPGLAVQKLRRRPSSFGRLVPWSFWGLPVTHYPLLATGRRHLNFNFRIKPERAGSALQRLQDIFLRYSLGLRHGSEDGVECAYPQRRMVRDG